MIYLERLILWLIIIILISWIIHKVGKRFVRNEKVKPFTGIIAFFVIILFPVTIAKTVQLYYCWKYRPFYKIIEPLGDDFEGYYGKGDFYNVHKEYPTLKYIDYKYLLYRQAKNGYETVLGEDMKLKMLPDIYDKEIAQAKKEFVENKKKTYVYVRQYIAKQGSEYCTWPRKELNVKNLITQHKDKIAKLEEEGRQVASGKVFQKNPEIYVNGYLKNRINKHLETIAFLQSGQCVAKKIIPEEEVSRYVIRSNETQALEDVILLRIPEIVVASYYKIPFFINRLNHKVYAWGSSVNVEWDLYGVSGQEGAKPYFYCGKGFNLTKKMIEEKGVKYGN
jgi:hypothetical protein